MAGPDQLVPGNCYFTCAFHDRDMLFPYIETLKFVRSIEDEDGTRLWMFDDAPDGEPDESKTLMSYRDEDLHQVLDFEGLQARLREVALDHPLRAPHPSASAQESPWRLDELREHVGALFDAGGARSVTITIRFTDDGFSLGRDDDGRFHASFFPHPRRDPEEEGRTRTLFQGVRPRDDYLADRGRTRVLVYPVEGTVDDLVALSVRILEQVYGLVPESGLRYVARGPDPGG